MIKGFKEFILRGNVVDLAVGVVMGAAFGNIVTALVKDILTPLIGAIAKVPDFSGLVFILNDSKFAYGDFLNVLISFLLVSIAVYFFIIVPMNALVKRMKHEKPADPSNKKCPECLSEIPLAARRCSHCTQLV
ncbi:MAG: large conductance mechanosensitive channel protein MscL [Patescibacteria group bacterium]